MINNKELLDSVLKTTQMGQIGIRSVLGVELDPDFRKAILSQLKEYDTIEHEARTIARNRNWNLQEINPSIRLLTDRMAKFNLSFGNTDSRIAAMMIRGNTNGIIKGHKNLHRLSTDDETVCSLTKKLLATENANILQMEKFL